MEQTADDRYNTIMQRIMERKGRWGGARPGAGRPRGQAYSEAVKARITPAQAKALRALAGGRGISWAIRQAISEWIARRVAGDENKDSGGDQPGAAS